MKKTLLRFFLRASSALIAHPAMPLRVQRALLNAARYSMRAPTGLEVEQIRLGSCNALQIDSRATRTDAVLLYLHGGAYISGGPGSHVRLAAQCGAAAGVRTCLPDYRLAPEHPCPAAIEDALAAYAALCDAGHQRIALVGDSAGGGLALATAQAIRDQGMALPRALVLLSPWTDLRVSADSYRTRAKQDPMLNAGWLDWAAGLYCAQLPRSDTRPSPLLGNFAGLPPMLVHVGDDEILLDDALQTIARAERAGVTVQSRVFAGLWHVFQAQAYSGMLPEADESLQAIGEFLRRQLAV